MTALIALEIMDEIDAGPGSYIKVPPEAVGVEGSSLYLKANEIVTAEELLYGMMLHSGNDAATAVALRTGGSMDNFLTSAPA
jgi:D-alanyl-D-alanine carboxypeptidase